MNPDDGDVATWPLVADRAEDDGHPALAEAIPLLLRGGNVTEAGSGPPLLLCERLVKVNKKLEKELEKVLD
jgi:hypothetical protein